MTFKPTASVTSRDDQPASLLQRSSWLERAQACLVGQIAGDSLGALVEFKTKSEISRLYPNGLHELANGGPWNIIAGQVTDDSEMAIALARTLARERRFVCASVFSTYVAWKNSAPFDIGITISKGLSRPFGGRVHSESQANGSLMRISPIGIFAAGDPERAASLARADSELTHPHPICVAACATLAAAIAVGIAGGTRDDMMKTAFDEAGDGAGAEPIRDALAAAQTALPGNFQVNMGWVLIAFQNAFHHLVHEASIEHAVSTTVAQGGDTDTNGAIVGALVGAAQGLNTVPSQWIEAISSCRPARGSGAPQPRPREYWPNDCLDLAIRVLMAAEQYE